MWSLVVVEHLDVAAYASSAALAAALLALPVCGAVRVAALRAYQRARVLTGVAPVFRASDRAATLRFLRASRVALDDGTLLCVRRGSLLARDEDGQLRLDGAAVASDAAHVCRAHVRLRLYESAPAHWSRLYAPPAA